MHLSKPILQDVTATVRIEHINTDDGNVKAEERTVTFSKGASSVALEVATQDNNEFQGGRSYRVSIVEAKGATLHDSSKQIETTINENDKPPVPKMVAGSEPGSVEITPVDGADYLNVRYRDETDFERILTLRRNKEGVWQRLNGTWLAELPEHVSLDAHSGKLTLGAKSVKDGSTIVAFNEANSIKGETGTFIADNNDGTSQHNRPGSIAIKGEAKVGVELSAEITDPDGVPDNVQYQWLRNGEKIDGATGSTYRLSAEDIGRKISVQATYEDNAKHSETPKSAETDAVSNDQLQPQNHAPTEITLSNDLVNEAQEGAVVGKLTTTDPDTGDKHTYTVNDDRFEVTADGTLKLKAGQILDYGKEPTLKLSITTDDGHGGVFTKDFTLRVQDDPLYPPINPNEDGAVTISGDPKVGSTLTAEVKDGDGVPNDGVKYQWLRDGNPIASATGKSYVLTAEDAGHKITVKAEYDDNAKNHETPVSQPTENIADNSAPPPAANHPGSVTLEGEAKIGHTLTAKLTDVDGVPDSGIIWRWYGDDKLLPGVEGQTITLTDAVKGMQLRAEAVYTDKAGHAEKPISDLSPAVVPEAANNSDLIPPPAADAPHITLSGVTSVKEGEKATYTVSLDKPASEDVSVDVHVKHNSTDTSDANLTWNIQRVVIPKGETSKNFTVDTHNDGKAEGTETYTVEIGNALVGNVNDNVPPFSGSVSAQSMIIPAYKYPTGGWEKDTYWESVHKAGGGKVPYVIVNPASGVGEKVNSDYAKLIDDNITAGIKNIGYIRTHYQTRPIEEVKAEVDKYLELYGKDKIHGYFFDEITAQNNQGTAYMAELYRYVKAKAGDKLVMANPGTHITDAIAPYADIFVTSEVSAKTYLNNYEQPKSAFENDPKNAHRIMHMIHDVTPDQYDAVIKASRERNAGWVFPTSDTQENPLPEDQREKHPEQDGNPYNALPQNFDQLAANVNNLGMPTNPTQHDNNGKLATANIDNNHVTTEIVDANNAAPLEHHEPQLQPADGAVASAADGLEAAAADHTRGGDGHDVLIGDGIDAAAYSQLVSHSGEDLLQYLGQHSAELLAASQHSANHELHGGTGDDVLIAGHGAQLLEGGAGADTFAYLLDSNDAASWNEPSRILDFNPQEGDRIVLAGGEHLKAEVSHDASGQHLHVTDDAGHSRTIDIGAQNGKTLTAEDILSHVEIRTPQGYSEPASGVPQTHHLPQDDHSHLI